MHAHTLLPKDAMRNVIYIYIYIVFSHPALTELRDETQYQKETRQTFALKMHEDIEHIGGRIIKYKNAMIY